jgi:hypothetical protein
LKKNSVVITAVLYGVAAGALAHAQAPLAGGAAPTKIAVVNLQEAMARTKDGQKVAAEINSKFGPKKAEFDKRQEDIAQLTDKLTKGRATMSDDAQKQLSAEIQRKQTDASASAKIPRRTWTTTKPRLPGAANENGADPAAIRHSEQFRRGDRCRATVARTVVCRRHQYHRRNGSAVRSGTPGGRDARAAAPKPTAPAPPPAPPAKKQ